MPDITSEEIAATQGTRLSETPPWMSYAAEMDEKLDPTLEAAVDDYSTHRHQESSNQNKEELHRWQEENAALAKQYQFIKPEEYADEGPRFGKVLSHDKFIGILRDKCRNRSFWYKEHPQPDKITLLWGEAGGTTAPKYACWVQAGFMPEFSMVRFDDHGVPVNEKRRGWRTCLLQMIIQGILTEQQVIGMFGEARGPASDRYNRTLQAFRTQHDLD